MRTNRPLQQVRTMRQCNSEGHVTLQKMRTMQHCSKWEPWDFVTTENQATLQQVRTTLLYCTLQKRGPCDIATSEDHATFHQVKTMKICIATSGQCDDAPPWLMQHCMQHVGGKRHFNMRRTGGQEECVAGLPMVPPPPPHQGHTARCSHGADTLHQPTLLKEQSKYFF